MLAAFLLFPGFFVVAIVLSFLPTILAASRHHHNVLGVFLVNFFLGWTVIGWVIALVWALSQPRIFVVPGAYVPTAALLCPKCGVPIAPGAQFCSHCGASV
jgi:hypothetical protein